MIAKSLNYINSKIETLNLFSVVLCLCEKIRKGEQQYPAIPNGKEYNKIDLDKSDGKCYWRLIGDVSIEEVERMNSCGVDYLFKAPLKLVCFIDRKKSNSTQEEIIGAIIKEVTTTNAFLQSELSAKRVRVICKSYKTDREELAREEYTNIDFTPKYSYLYFSIEVELSVLTSSNCIPALCN